MTPNRTGVTLIETLAALAMVALVAPIVTQAWLTSMEAASRGRDLATASILASNQLQQLILEGSTSSSNGDFGEAYPNYRWKLDASAWEESNAMKQLDMTVIWTRNNNEEFTYRITTLIPANIDE